MAQLHFFLRLGFGSITPWYSIVGSSVGTSVGSIVFSKYFSKLTPHFLAVRISLSVSWSIFFVTRTVPAKYSTLTPLYCVFIFNIFSKFCFEFVNVDECATWVNVKMFCKVTFSCYSLVVIHLPKYGIHSI